MADLTDCLGYLVINNNTGSIVKVEGNLTNVERIAQTVSRIILLGNGESILKTGEKFNSIIINFEKFYYVIKRSDQQIYVIKHNQEKKS